MLFYIALIFFTSLFCSSHCDTDPTKSFSSDDLPFKISWKESKDEPYNSQESYFMRSSVGELYSCYLPDSTVGSSEGSSQENKVPSEVELLSPLLSRSICHSRQESYWSYEFCHNKHIRQYHEELHADKSSTIQEYYLGYYKEESNAFLNETSTTAKRPTIVLGESEYPYFAVNFTDGTACDLTFTPRRTTVYYVCLEATFGQIIHISEVPSCHYQLIFATNRLCSHPAYRIQKPPVNEINCYASEGSPRVPVGMVALDNERANLTSKSMLDVSSIFGPNAASNNVMVDRRVKRNHVLYNIRSTDKVTPVDSNDDNNDVADVDPETDLLSEMETLRNAALNNLKGLHDDLRNSVLRKKALSSETESSPFEVKLEDFLSGAKCMDVEELSVCFNKHITILQEDEISHKKKRVILGTWDRSAHIEWMARKRASKSDPAEENKLTFFYGNGSPCGAYVIHTSLLSLTCGESTTINFNLLYSKPRECEHRIDIISAYFCQSRVDEFGEGFPDSSSSSEEAREEEE